MTDDPGENPITISSDEDLGLGRVYKFNII